jgi:hypothetical protein
MAEFLSLMEKWDGYVPVRNAGLNESAVARFIDLMANAEHMPAHRQDYLLREVVTTSDFPSLFGFTLERDLLARYRAVVPDWQAYCARGTLPNFNQAELHKVQGNDTLLPEVSEKGEYLVAQMVDAHYHRQVKKFGRQFDISWESIINDALSAFSDLPQRFADAVVYTRAYNATGLFAVAAGPNPLLFGAGATITDVDGQVITNKGVLDLTIGNLQITLDLMASQTDVNGRPLGIRGTHLVVPNLLELTGRAILTSTLILSTAAAPIPNANVLSQMGLQLHVNPLLPVIDTSGNRNGTWYVFADPSQGKAIQMDFLRGNEDPEICMKASDKVTVGGGSLSPFSGDFATDNIFYRVRDVHGGTQLDPRYVYAQVHT